MTDCKENCLIGAMSKEEAETFIKGISKTGASEGVTEAFKKLGLETPEDVATFKEFFHLFLAYKQAKKWTVRALWDLLKKVWWLIVSWAARIIAFGGVMWMLSHVVGDEKLAQLAKLFK